MGLAVGESETGRALAVALPEFGFGDEDFVRPMLLLAVHIAFAGEEAVFDDDAISAKVDSLRLSSSAAINAFDAFDAFDER